MRRLWCAVAVGPLAVADNDDYRSQERGSTPASAHAHTACGDPIVGCTVDQETLNFDSRATVKGSPDPALRLFDERAGK